MRFFGLVLMVLSVSAVKRHEFKTCKDLSFCQRNRFLASTLDYKVSYYVPVQTIQRIWGGIRFNLQSPLEPSPFLKGEAALLTNNALYIYIDEISPMYPRFRTSKDDILNPKTLDFNNNYDVQASQVVWKTGGYKYVLKFDPFSIQGFYKDQLILSVNERSLMNFDRYRSKETVLPHDGNKIIDSTGLPGEFKLWEETWKDFTDSNLRGPSSIGLDITFANTDHVYGIPEHADQMSLRDTVTSEPYRLYNLDVFEFELNERMALYGSVPFMLSVHGGIFWNNPSETWVDVATVKNQKQTHWFSETGVLEFYLFLSDSPKNLVSTFTIFTGPPLLPPLFSLAYHQCRWNYYSQKELLEIEQGFEDHNLPLDVLWLDIEHTPHRTYFTWDYKSFPEPIKMITHLSSHGRKLVNIVDPHLSTNPNFYVNKIFKENDLLVKTENGEVYQAHCWPGQSTWPDFTCKEGRKLWSEQFRLDRYKDTTNDVFIWNDMNEPAVFGGPENTMPKTNLHKGGVEHRDLHNLYGVFMQRATAEGLVMRNPNARPFVLSRAFYAGTQKYGAIWTGDNMAKWEYMEAHVPMCLSVALGGISFCGSDIGGFFGEPSAELMVRWYQVAVYSPFFRSHAHIETKKREPWVFGEDALNNIRFSLQQRYKLLPYWYSLFYEYSTQGTPVIQAMFLQYPQDKLTHNLDKQFHLGDALLIVGLSTPAQKSVKVYLPDARWFDFHTYQEVRQIGMLEWTTSEKYVPVFAKGGNIIVMQERPRRSSGLMREDPYTFLVVLDKDFNAKGRFFVDDGSSFNYLSGEFLESEIEFRENQLRYTVTHVWTQGNELEKIVLLGLQGEPMHVVAESSCSKENIGFYVDGGVVTVKLPKVKINESWTISLIY